MLQDGQEFLKLLLSKVESLLAACPLPVGAAADRHPAIPVVPAFPAPCFLLLVVLAADTKRRSCAGS